MKKRIISLALILSMVLTLFVGCGKKEQALLTEDGKVILRVGIPQNANVTDYENNSFTKYLEESLNIKIKFVFFSSNSTEYKTQLALMCSANETLPDVMTGFHHLGRYTVNAYGQDGYFLDLTDLIEEYGTNYKEQLAKWDKDYQEYIVERGTDAETGGFYGMPYASILLPDNIHTLMYINQEWLKAVNKEMPTTLDEFYAVLKAFKEQDPNGNGKADEIPMVSKAGVSRGIETYIINAFVYYDTRDPYNVTNGKVWAPYTSNEYRDSLIYLNKLCKEGLFSDLCFTAKGNNELKTLITPTNNVAKVGVWCGHPSIMSNVKTTILDQYVALPCLEGVTDKGGYTTVMREDVYYSAYITKDCANVEVAMKFLDFFYNDETVTRARHGEKGVDWVEEKGIGELGHESSIKVLNDNAFFGGSSTWCLNGASFVNEDNYIAVATEGTGRQAESSRLIRETYELVKNAKQPKELAQNLTYNAEEYDIREEYYGQLEAYVHEQRVLFIMGEKNPSSDSDWNNYLSTLEKLGQSKLLDVAQSAYERSSK